MDEAVQHHISSKFGNMRLELDEPTRDIPYLEPRKPASLSKEIVVVFGDNYNIISLRDKTDE